MGSRGATLGDAPAHARRDRGPQGRDPRLALLRRGGRRLDRPGLPARHGSAREHRDRSRHHKRALRRRRAQPTVPGDRARDRRGAHAARARLRHRAPLPHERGSLEPAHARTPPRADDPARDDGGQRRRRASGARDVRLHDAHPRRGRGRSLSGRSRAARAVRAPLPSDRVYVRARWRPQPDPSRAQLEPLRQRRRKAPRRGRAPHLPAAADRLDHERRSARHLGRSVVPGALRSLHPRLAQRRRGAAACARDPARRRARGTRAREARTRRSASRRRSR